MAERFVKIPMRLFADDMWKERRELSKFEAFIWLLLHKAWEPMDVMFGGRMVGVGVNECAVSVRYLARQWSWSEKKVRTYLRHLCDLGLVDINMKDRTTIIRVGAHKRAQQGHTKRHTEKNDNQEVTEREGTPKGTEKGTPRAHNILDKIDKLDNIYISHNIRARVSDEVDQMRSDTAWVELVCMRFRASPLVVLGALKEFQMDMECRAVEGHESLADAKSHFVSWYQKKREKENGNGKIIGNDARREEERQQRLQSYAARVERVRRGE